MAYASPEEIASAAQALLDGRLVVMPTETVYGLAANALNAQAVGEIFKAKGRPAENPLIVHARDVEAVGSVAASWPAEAQVLADRFWPGPLTIVLPKRSQVPDLVTGGLSTVAVRVPAHPVARELLRVAGVPIAAPSANRFMQLSPTRAEDVAPLISAVAFSVLDGGPCEVGIESTIVDLSGQKPRLLRPGGVSRSELELVLGPMGEAAKSDRPLAPGMYRRHYSPNTPVRLAEELGPEDAGLTLTAPKNRNQVRLPESPTGYAAGLYAALRSLDQDGFSELVVQLPPATPEWEAVRDRLLKAVG